ncbi:MULTISPECIES: DUF4168 domain-containing protein [unclassified Rhizobium]|uniref:DUF4168 domain-containing protein n=1 Tax=unclassified Rhizobium TaxID=2613769 RepID=UPI0006FF3CB3|nr:MULTISPECIES: DUF4168 domain-containing protein [unclassified Rhizobium]KQV38277.1 hypothetical protein ASC86_08640 [Rhizobium sp. Root1212]KRD30933.1 hypothetical protein ASE37_08635 [Rhizobium sp. Root268]
MTNMPVAALTAAAWSLIVVSTPAFAQEAAVPQAGAQIPATAPAAISEEKLDAFAVAYLKVDSVRQSFAAKIGAEKDAVSRQKLQNEANKRMIDAVQNSPGVSVEEYRAIVSTAQVNPEVARKLQAKLKANGAP